MKVLLKSCGVLLLVTLGLVMGVVVFQQAIPPQFASLFAFADVIRLVMLIEGIGFVVAFLVFWLWAACSSAPSDLATLPYPDQAKDATLYYGS